MNQEKNQLLLLTNPGSSSRKYELARNGETLCTLHFEIEGKDVVCTVKQSDGTKHKITDGFKKLIDSVKYAKKILEDEGYLDKDTKLSAIVARVAAPGDYWTKDHLVDDACLKELEAAKKRAPLHVPVVAAEIEECVKEFKGTPVITVSDSGFHTTRPDVNRYPAISKELADRAGIKSYGYHGLSMGSIAHFLAEHNLTAEKVIVCHIGSGSSITALRNNESYDTTMGYSPLGGLVMATRCGNTVGVDMALLIAREEKLSLEELEQYLNKQCGLKGLTGSDDMREVISMRDDSDANAKLAYDMYIKNIQRNIGQLAASMGGVDALVFTATVGERNAEIRRDVIAGLEFLGFKINDTKNSDGLGDEPYCVISTGSSKPIYVIQTDETGEMIRRAQQLLSELTI